MVRCQIPWNTVTCDTTFDFCGFERLGNGSRTSSHDVLMASTSQEVGSFDIELWFGAASVSGTIAVDGLSLSHN